MREPLVTATALARRFGSGTGATDALRSATCTIWPGDRIALVGPSGSGKSTLLHLLGGLDDPTDGTVVWPALGSRQALRPAGIGDIFQGPSLLPPLSVLENVRLPLQLLGESDALAVQGAEAALHAFGIAHLADKLPEEISGGQAQRVAIARTVASCPRLVLADEPTGQLDSDTAAATLTTLFSVLADQGTAIVVSTHDPRVAERLDIQWSMRDGVLETMPATEAAMSSRTGEDPREPLVFGSGGQP